MNSREELLDKLFQELEEPEIPEGAITVKMLSEKRNRNEKFCRSYLDMKVHDGMMDFVIVRHTKWYYEK